MRLIHKAADLSDGFMILRQEALRYFGNPEIYMEKVLQKSRHAEIQILAGADGVALR